MKRLLKDLMLAFALLLVIYLLLEYRYRNYRTGADFMIEKFRSKKEKAQVLFLGNSHMMPLVLCMDSIAGNFSVSLTSGGIDFFWSWILLNKYADSLPDLKYIVIGTDDELMGYNQSYFRQEYVNRALCRYTDTLYNYTLMNRFLATSNFFRSNRDYHYLFSKQDYGDLTRMFIPLSPQASITKAFCRDRALEHSVTLFEEKLIPENLIFLERIIEIARGKSIEVIFVSPPKVSEFLVQRNMENVNKAHHALDSLVVASRVTYYDFTRSGYFPDSLFRDPDHLSKRGAANVLRLIKGKKGKEIFSMNEIR